MNTITERAQLAKTRRSISSRAVPSMSAEPLSP